MTVAGGAEVTLRLMGEPPLASDADRVMLDFVAATRRATQQRTARENVEDLCDPGTFVEYGALALAAQRARHSKA